MDGHNPKPKAVNYLTKLNNMQTNLYLYVFHYTNSEIMYIFEVSDLENPMYTSEEPCYSKRKYILRCEWLNFLESRHMNSNNIKAGSRYIFR